MTEICHGTNAGPVLRLFWGSGDPSGDKSTLPPLTSLKLIHLFGCHNRYYMMQFLSAPERSVRDSAHAVDIYLAVHTKIPLKYKFGTCWRIVLREQDRSKRSARKERTRVAEPDECGKTAFTEAEKSGFILQAHCLSHTIKAGPLR